MKPTLFILCIAAVTSVPASISASERISDASGVQLVGLRSTATEPESFVTLAPPQGRPKKLPWTADLTLADAIAKALPRGARLPAKATIFRGRTVRSYNLLAIERGTAPDPKLQANDSIQFQAIYYPSQQ